MDVVILHGTEGTPEGNWFPWLKGELEKRGYQVHAPRLPTPDGQSLESWQQALKMQVPNIGRETILIGHSCGATFLLSVLQHLKRPVRQSIFVSGFLEKLGNEFFDTLNKTFIEPHFKWDKILKNAGEITVLQGENDPYVPLVTAERFAAHLKTPLTLIPKGGHLNAESGYTTFPELLKIIL